jgi:hypothetical protein
MPKRDEKRVGILLCTDATSRLRNRSMFSAQWINAIAASVSAIVAAITLYFLWRDRQAKVRDIGVAKSLSSSFGANPPSELVEQFVASLRARNEAHDRVLRAIPRKILSWTFGLVGSGMLLYALSVWLSGSSLAVIWVPINLIAAIAMWYYIIQTSERRMLSIVQNIHAQFKAFAQNDLFTVDLAIELRNSMRQKSKPITLVELDDYLLAELARRLDAKQLVKIGQVGGR